MNPSPAQNKTVSIVAPFYNEEGGVELFYETLCGVFQKTPDCDFEIVCVNDGSCDQTLSRLVALSERDARVCVVEFSRNFGKESALTAGIDTACGDAVIPMDSDLQDPPELIPLMIAEWRKGFEVVLAYRQDRHADSFLKRKSAELFYQTHNKLSQIKIPENVGDFRLMDRVVVEALKRLPERQRFMKGLFAWIGFRTTTLPYAREERATGKTKFSGWRLWNFALEGITSFSIVPLKIWSYIGAVGALAAFSYAMFIIARTLLFGKDVPGYASLFVAILFFGSLQLISIGVLGEYVGRIYMEAKQRPIYVIRKIYKHKDGVK